MTIVFEDPARPGRLVAHRAVKRLPGDGPPVWTTRGDANARADPYPVHAPAIRGRVRWAIPRLGSLGSALHGPITVIVLVGVPLALLAATEARALRRRRTTRVDISDQEDVHADQRSAIRGSVRVFAVRDPSSADDHSREAFVEVFLRRDDALRFVEDLRQQSPTLADTLQIVERDLNAPLPPLER